MRLRTSLKGVPGVRIGGHNAAAGLEAATMANSIATFSKEIHGFCFSLTILMRNVFIMKVSNIVLALPAGPDFKCNGYNSSYRKGM